MRVVGEKAHCRELGLSPLLSLNVPWSGRSWVGKPFKRMAGSTGLEPAASAVTGQR